uniref:Disease resistance R13L4/SHOC-2-like LRR domain-containing protein n=1 Tax=Quercus lobata TaxID=97700 RepID=A0A7N2MPL9_QUELO
MGFGGVFVVVRWAIAMGLGWVVAVGLGWVSGVLLWVYRYEVVGVYRVRNIASAGSEIRDVMQPFPNEVFDLDRSLHILDLTHSKIVDIPLDISKLIKMQHLISAKNLVQQLPTNLGTLHCLKLIALDGIQMTSLPAEIGQLVMLERLSISGNLLTCLPKTIGSLRNLLLLDVSNNKLKSLPESIGSCFSLEELQANGHYPQKNLSRNPRIDFPFSPPPDHTLSYLWIMTHHSCIGWAHLCILPLILDLLWRELFSDLSFFVGLLLSRARPCLIIISSKIYLHQSAISFT